MLVMIQSTGDTGVSSVVHRWSHMKAVPVCVFSAHGGAESESRSVVACF